MPGLVCCRGGIVFGCTPGLSILPLKAPQLAIRLCVQQAGGFSDSVGGKCLQNCNLGTKSALLSGERCCLWRDVQRGFGDRGTSLPGLDLYWLNTSRGAGLAPVGSRTAPLSMWPPLHEGGGLS